MGLAGELRAIRTARAPSPEAPVFCGLPGGRLKQTTLAAIIHRASARAGLEKHVTAHILRHTAATWLRQELGDTRLVAEYLGHADFSTVARYAHVERSELFAAAGRLEQLAISRPEPEPSTDVRPVDRREQCSSSAEGSKNASSGSERRRRRRSRRRRR
jgi:hypothetical protein